jgi:hypothetical protein
MPSCSSKPSRSSFAPRTWRRRRSSCGPGGLAKKDNRQPSRSHRPCFKSRRRRSAGRRSTRRRSRCRDEWPARERNRSACVTTCCSSGHLPAGARSHGGGGAVAREWLQTIVRARAPESDPRPSPHAPQLGDWRGGIGLRGVGGCGGRMRPSPGRCRHGPQPAGAYRVVAVDLDPRKPARPGLPLGRARGWRRISRQADRGPRASQLQSLIADPGARRSRRDVLFVCGREDARRRLPRPHPAPWVRGRATDDTSYPGPFAFGYYHRPGWRQV